MAEQPANGKSAIVTGGGTGVGRAAALALLDAGWRVAVAGRRLGPLQEVAAQCPDRALAVSVDMTRPDSVRALFDRVAGLFGRVDLLFNNAGIILPPQPLEDLQVEDWKRVVDTNLSGMFYGIQNAFRVMKAQHPMGGRIINNGSLSAHAPRPNSVAYTATKHAVTGLTKAASLDGRRYNIAVGQIDIGRTSSEMSRNIPEALRKPLADPEMNASVVAQSIVHMASLPADANVLFHTVLSTRTPFVGRG